MSKILDKLLENKDQPVQIQTSKELKVRKGQEPITKVSEYTAIVGGDYEKLESTIERRQLQEAAGEEPSAKSGKLPWGEWVEFPYTISHKDETYIRLTKSPESTSKATYFRNGEAITKEEAIEACLASEFPKTPSETEIFNIKVSSILKVGIAS